MRNAQAILQFSGYPLEPIVAREVQKSYNQKLRIASRNVNNVRATMYSKEAQPACSACNQENWGVEWFSNYE